MKSLLISILLLAQFCSFACDCEWQGNFIEMGKLNYPIAIVEPIEFLDQEDKHYGKFNLGVKVKIIRMIRGQVKTKTAIIWRGLNSCAESIDHFEIGKTFILHLKPYRHLNELQEYGWNYNHVYITEICGEYSARISNDSVFSHAPMYHDQTIENMSIDTFLQRIDQTILDE